MNTQVEKSKYSRTLAAGVFPITGTKTFDNPFPGKEIVVRPLLRVLEADTPATEANKAVHFSVEVSNDKRTFIVQAWKATGAGDTTLIAATSEVEVQVEVEVIGE